MKAPSTQKRYLDKAEDLKSPHIQHRGTQDMPSLKDLDDRRASNEIVRFEVNEAYTEQFHDIEQESAPRNYPVVPGTREKSNSRKSNKSQDARRSIEVQGELPAEFELE